jgi:hypothetical protein
VSFRIIGASLLTLSAFAFCETLVMRPGAEGKDATLFSRTDAVEKNFGDAVQIQASTWTWNGDGLGQGTFRGLIAFDLGAIPAGAVIKSAKLDLYCDTINYTKGHSSLSESNAAYLMRVKDAWAESTVTWKNQPEADTAGRIKLDSSKKVIQNYSVDVTAMVSVMAADSSKNHGFLFRSVSEATYNAMIFGSGDNKDSSLHPRLEVEYELPDTGKGTKFSARPGVNGKDATLFNRKDAIAKNYGNAAQLQAGSWTWNADGLGDGTFRGLIEFDLTGVPASAVVKSAKLRLYCDTVNYTKGHSSLSASNAAYLMRVKEAWVESTVTWNNQPDADTVGRVTLAKSKGLVQDYSVDVKGMVADMVANPSGNHGFLLRSISETAYNSMGFGSGDHADSALHPMLEIEYEVPTRAGKTLADLRTRGETLEYRIAAGELLLSRTTAGQLIDLHGKVLTRFANTGSVSLGGLKSGAYILRTEGSAYRIFVP